MGNTNTKPIKSDKMNKSIHDQINICSLYADLSTSVLVDNKINSIIELFFNDEYNIDILCLRGIADTKICKMILRKLYKYGDIRMYTYPSMDTFGITIKNSLEMTLSKSNDDDIDVIDELILSKYPIISSTKIKLHKNYIYICNIEFYDTIVGIYNCELPDDNISESNKYLRTLCISELKNAILHNSEEILRNTRISSYNHIHIVCSSLNIDEMINKQINTEYLECLRTIEGLDLYRYVRTIKHMPIDNFKDSTNIKGNRSDYILFILNNFNAIDDLNNIKKILYNDKKCVVSNCILIKHLPYLDNYPVLASLMIKRNIIHSVPNNTKEHVEEID